MITKLAPSLLLIVAILMTSCATVQRETVETRIGNLTFSHDFADGYPGNYYTLAFDSETNRLVGVYHHLGLNQNFDVYFIRR